MHEGQCCIPEAASKISDANFAAIRCSLNHQLLNIGEDQAVELSTGMVVANVVAAIQDVSLVGARGLLNIDPIEVLLLLGRLNSCTVRHDALNHGCTALH